MGWVRLLGQLVIRFLSKKLPWFGAMIGWLYTDTPVGGAVDEAFGLFTAVTIPVSIFMTCAWLWLRARDAKARDRLLDLHLPRPPADPPPREDDDPDPDVDPLDDPDVAAAPRPAVEEGAPA
jgi:hypothetical protein